jgi:hypothetical protein
MGETLKLGLGKENTFCANPIRSSPTTFGAIIVMN